MNADDYAKVRELYHALADKPAEGQERELQSANVSNEIRAEVFALLGHEAYMTAFRDERLGEVGAQLVKASPGTEPDLPQYVANFRVLSLLGRGGMGVVYRCQQERPQRLVAVKVLQSFAASPDVQRRFEYEAEILARLDHPYVAKIFQSGSDPKLGQLPYIAMELVEGTDLETHCRIHGLDATERLELFARICEGVEHAHQNGVVHRDLKPANILISADGRPRILDFGIARPITEDDTSTPGCTLSGAVLGSLAWMSPEQARGDLSKIDVRTDVYSLGVVLYRLLAGKPPYDVEGKSPWEAARTICEDEPLRLGRVKASLHGDLEAITAKALEKEPARRYPGAGALGRDVRRVLEFEPVEARASSGVYQLRKFARRNRVLVGSAGLLLLAILAGLISSLLLWRQAEAARSDATREAQRATEEARTSSQVLSLVTRMFHGASEFAGPDTEVTVREILDRSAPLVQEELKYEPVALAQLSHTLGTVYREIGQLGAAVPFLETALRIRREQADTDELRLAETVHATALAYWELGRYDDAEPLYEESIRLSTEHFGLHSPETLERLTNQANLFVRQGLAREAEGVFHEVMSGLEQLDNKPVRAGALSSYVTFLLNEGRFEEAEAPANEAYEIRRDRYGAEHPSTLSSLNSLAQLYLRLRRHAKGLELSKQVVQGMRSALGALHPSTLITSRNLANTYLSRNELPLAEEILVDILPKMEEVMGIRHQYTISARQVLASLRGRQGRVEESIDLYRQNLELREEELGEDHPDTIRSYRTLAKAVWDHEDIDNAEELLQEALKRSTRSRGPDHENTILLHQNLCVMYRRELMWEKFDVEVSHALEKAHRTLGNLHRITCGLRTIQALSQADRDDFEAAARLLSELYGEAAAKLEKGNPIKLKTGDLLLDMLGRLNDLERSRELVRELIRETDPSSSRMVRRQALARQLGIPMEDS